MSNETEIKGYRELTDDEKIIINTYKSIEQNVLDKCRFIETVGSPDPRWHSIGLTHIQQGFMALVRAVAKPGCVKCNAIKEDEK
jgi:hypothetical protein